MTVEQVIIIGSGPAAYTAALYAARANLTPLCLEGELSNDLLPGGQLMTTTEVENYPGYPEGVSGPDLVADLKKQAERFGTRFLYQTATSLDLSKQPLTVCCGTESFHCRALIIATGANAKYLGLHSEQAYMNRGVSACATCDGALPRFRNQPVVVVGGGDTAMEEAIFLANFASRVHIVHRRDKFRASKIMADRAIRHPKIQIEWNSIVEEILGNEKDGVTSVRLQDSNTGATRVIECTGYFAAIGHQPNSSIVEGLLNRDTNGYILTEGKTAYTNIPGVFAAGDVQDHVYRQAITAAGSGCMAAIDATRWLETQEA